MNDVIKNIVIIFGVLLCAMPAWAQDKPAVSAPNSKIAFAAGDLDGDFTLHSRGAYTLPLSHQFGIQFDGLGSLVKSEVAGAIGIHTFWRDPQKALIGVYGGYMDRGWPNISEIGNLGLEGEYYLEDITFSGMIGQEFGDRDEIFLAGLISVYNSDEDLHLYAGYSNQLGMDMAHFGFEYDVNIQQGHTLFLNTVYTQCDETLVLFGLRFYFGETKSLKARHREDDPVFAPQLGNHMNLDSCGMSAMAGGGVPGL